MADFFMNDNFCSVPAHHQSIESTSLAKINLGVQRKLFMDDRTLESEFQALFAEGKAFPAKQPLIKNKLGRLLTDNKSLLVGAMAQSTCFNDAWLDLMNSFWGNLWKITTCDSAWCDSKKVINRIRFTLKKRIVDREVKQRGYIKFEEVPEDFEEVPKDLDAADKRLRELNLLAKATPRSLDAPIGDDASMTLADTIPARADNENFVWLRKLVDDDADSELKDMVMGIQPDLNAQNTLQLFLDGHSWRDLAKQFGVNEQTFSSFVNRRCLKLLKRLWDESEKLQDEETLKKIQEKSQANSETL
jgi:hypothetical protein